MMRRTLAVLCLLAAAGLATGCGSADNTNATRNGVVETNVNMSQKATDKPSNTATVTNNNGNDNTAGVKSMNNNNAKH
ncbi:MAG: hypothetical protein QOC96_2730 [Acidobacteriota bacterium]|jgi:hypothetical protein|nr:hypothetical protein [Acidobacteriota bacterium]